MIEWENPVLTFSCRYTKTKTINAYRVTISENNLRANRTEFLQLRIQRKGRMEMGRKRRDAV